MEQWDEHDERSAEELFSAGIELFNKALYFESHEILEKLWLRQVGSEKQFTQGLIQIAVGLYHLNKENSIGAQKLLERGLTRIKSSAALEPDLDVELLICETERVHGSVVSDTWRTCLPPFPQIVKRDSVR